MSMTRPSANRDFTVTASGGGINPKDFFVLRLHGQEALSQLAKYQLELICDNSVELDIDKLVESKITVDIAWQRASTTSNRFVTAHVSAVAVAKESEFQKRYTLQCRPWLWFLTFSSHSRIFQNKKVPAIIEEVFKQAGYKDYELDLKSDYPEREYCVQYQETDFAFVSRLMEDEGIYYYYEHTDTKATLILADHNQYPKQSPEAVSFIGSHQQTNTEMWAGITQCQLQKQAGSAKYEIDDFNFTKPETDLLSKESIGKGKRVLYEYPGGFIDKDAGKTKAQRRADAHGASEHQLLGEGHEVNMLPGYQFKLTNHSFIPEASYITTQVEFECSTEQYRNHFIAYNADKICRPIPHTPKPRIHGTQTAIVTGPKGEEIYTDDYGRIKVQFHWDQDGENDENSSCWIRVSQLWAGNGWGALYIPRIKQEVVVTFLEGSPDQPLVTGCVYNASHKPPYELPMEMTKSTLKSGSTKQGGPDDYNEIRFEDAVGSEEVYIQAQRDMNVLIKKNRETILKKGNDILKLEDGNYTIDISGDFDLKVAGKITINGESIDQKARKAFTQNAGTALSQAAGTDFSQSAGTNMKLDAKIKLEANSGVQTTVGSKVKTEVTGTMLDVKGTTITTVNGALVKIN